MSFAWLFCSLVATPAPVDHHLVPGADFDDFAQSRRSAKRKILKNSKNTS